MYVPYNLIEYSDNYSDTSGILWNFKREEIEGDVDLTVHNALLFEYKANLIGNTENNGTKNGVKIAIPLKYLSNILRYLEVPLNNCKIELSLKWHENCILPSAGTTAIVKKELSDKNNIIQEAKKLFDLRV